MLGALPGIFLVVTWGQKENPNVSEHEKNKAEEEAMRTPWDGLG